MNIRKAKIEDIPRLMSMFAKARCFMAEVGNPTQWAPDYPAVDMVENDISKGDCYVCIEDDAIVGTFTFIIGDDPTYHLIEDGAWHYDLPYGVIHRVASDGKTKGVARACFDYCKGQINYLRIDTHKDNKPMLSVIKKNGFSECGTIYVYDGSARTAFDLLIF